MFKNKGGPFGLGDPDDRTLRKTEKDVILTKMYKEEAEKKCQKTFQMFMSCAKEAGLTITWKCQEENKRHNECLVEWLKNPQMIEEVTNRYLDARSYYRRTGKPLIKYEGKVKARSGFC